MTEHAKDTIRLFEQFDPNLQIVDLSDDEIDNADNPFGEGE